MASTSSEPEGISKEAVPDHLEIVGVPSYVESWSVAKIPGFVIAVLKRWRREFGELPAHFYVVMCPQVEINARGGLAAEVYELTDPKLRCRHFTGCHKPYSVIIFGGEDADQRRAGVQALLPWSEGYEVDLLGNAVRLRFVEATEDMEEPVAASPKPQRTLQQLLESGELVTILE